MPGPRSSSSRKLSPQVSRASSGRRLSSAAGGQSPSAFDELLCSDLSCTEETRRIAWVSTRGDPMRHSSDADFFRWRAAAELELAFAAQDPTVAQIHRHMADQPHPAGQSQLGAECPTPHALFARQRARRVRLLLGRLVCRGTSRATGPSILRRLALPCSGWARSTTRFPVWVAAGAVPKRPLHQPRGAGRLVILRRDSLLEHVGN